MNTEEYLRFYSRIRKTFFNEFGYDLFFIGGTLLGYVREKQFLKNDKDMDVAYFSKFKFAHCVRDEMAEIIGRLIELEERVSFIRSNYSVVTLSRCHQLLSMERR